MARGPVERVGVEDAVGLALADHLAGADERPVQLGAFLHGEHAERGAPRLAEQVDLVLVEAVAQVVGDGDRVVDVAVEGDRVGRVELVVRRAGAALVPGDDGDVFFELGQVAAHGAELAATGAAGEEQQHRVVDAVPADHQREVVAVDVDGGQLGDRCPATSSPSASTIGSVRAGRARPTVRGEPERGDARRRRCVRTMRGHRSLSVGAPGSMRSGGAGTDGRAERHRHQRQQGVEAAAGDEGEHAVAADVDAVDRRAVGAEAGEFEHDGERDRARSSIAQRDRSRRVRRACRRAG